MMTSKKIRILMLVLGASYLFSGALLITGCSSKGQQKGVPGAGPASPISVASVTGMDVPLQIRAIGNVEAYSTVQVKALVGGQMVGVYFKEGQDVKRGDLLFKIDPRPFQIGLEQAEANLTRDRAQLKNADGEVKRYADLAQKDYVTKEHYDQLVVNAEVLRASARGDEATVENARLQLEYCSIQSPIDGRTGSLMVHPGNIVKANDTISLVVIYQTSPIYVSFSVPEQNLPLIKKYMAQEEIKTGAVVNEQESPIPGVLTFVDNSIDTTTGTINLKATFPNTDRALWPGQFLNVVLTLTVEKNVISIPSQAVQTGQNGQYVMVVRSDMTVESRPVEVERTYGENAVIRSGLKQGETVATDGLLRLAPGSRVVIKKAI
jgi:multidrug efflux system membrane fusion protein